MCFKRGHTFTFNTYLEIFNKYDIWNLLQNNLVLKWGKWQMFRMDVCVHVCVEEVWLWTDDFWVGENFIILSFLAFRIKLYLFIYWLHWVLIAARAFSSWGDLGLLSCDAWASHFGAWASHCGAFSCCSSWALECWLIFRVRGFSSFQHVGSSWIRDWTSIPCFAGWIPNQRTTREVLFFLLLICLKFRR